jgi:methionyl-tRNA formyltransferase
LENDNFESVHDKLIEASSTGLIKAIELFKNGQATYTRQGESFTYAEKITKADCLIDFSDKVKAVHNKIRGLSPIPVAFTKMPDGKILKVTKAHVSSDDFNGKVGEVVSLDNGIFIKWSSINIPLKEG